MINLWKKEDLNLLSEYPKEVVESVYNIIDILDENYGYNRKLTDNGGYVCIIEDIISSDYSVTVISKNEETEYLLK